jgi:hypothetical protein
MVAIMDGVVAATDRAAVGAFILIALQEVFRTADFGSLEAMSKAVVGTYWPS